MTDTILRQLMYDLQFGSGVISVNRWGRGLSNHWAGLSLRNVFFLQQ